jgi:hypothetical protein
MSKLSKMLTAIAFAVPVLFLGACGATDPNAGRVSYDMSGITFNDSSFTYDGTAHSIFISGTLPEGVNVNYTGNAQTNAGNYTVTAAFTGTAEKYFPLDDKTAKMTIAQADIPGITFLGKTFVYDGKSHSLGIGGSLPAGVSVNYTGNDVMDAGTYEIVASFTDTTGNYKKLPDMKATITIQKATFDMSKIGFNDVTYVYDGKEKKVEITGTLPEGVSVSYKDNTLTNAGSVKATASFTHTNKNYNVIPDKTATLTVSKSEVAGITFEGSTAVYDGSEHSLAIAGTLPEGVKVTYTNNAQKNAGAYEVVAHFEDTTGNYTVPADMKATLTINKKAIEGITLADATKTYNGQAFTLGIAGTLPEGVNVTYSGQDHAVNTGAYPVVAHFVDTTGNYIVPADLNATLTIVASSSEFTGVKFEGATYTYDGTEHALAISGITLPAGVSVTYTANKATAAGVYNAVAHFVDSTGNYTVPDDLKAVLTINKATYDMSGVSFNDVDVVYDGTEQKVEITGTLPAGVTVAYTSNKRTTAGSIAATAVFSGDYANYNKIDDMTATLVVEKASYDMSGVAVHASYTYDGVSKYIEVTGLPSGVSVAYSVNNAQVNAGTYAITITFTYDTANYKLINNETLVNLGFSSDKLVTNLTIAKAVIDMSAVTFENATVTYDGDSHSIEVGNLPSLVTVSYSNNGKANAGTYTVTATLKYDSKNYTLSDNFADTLTATLTIDKATYAPVFNDVSVTYDGKSHSIYLTGALPAGVTVTYSDYDHINAGAHDVTASFAVTNNYNAIADITATLTIEKADYDLSGISFADGTFTYDGSAHSLAFTGTLPSGQQASDFIHASYAGNGVTAAGTYTVVLSFAVDANHNVPSSISKSLVIDKAAITGLGFADKTVTYDGSAHPLAITGTLPSGVTVSYTNNASFKAGTYTVTASFTDSTGNYVAPDNMTATLTIAKAVYDMSGVSFEDTSYTYDGSVKTLLITGTLPTGVSVTYKYNQLTAAGTSSAEADFSGDAENYELISSMHATLTIDKQQLTGYVFNDVTVTYDGSEHALTFTGTLPAGVTFKITDGTRTVVGSQTGFLSFTDSTGNYIVPDQMSANLTINKAVYNMAGVAFADTSLVYNGSEQKVEITGTLPAGVTVAYTANTMTNVGTATATASFTGDATNYELIPDMTASLTITKYTLPAPDITWSAGKVTWASVSDLATGYVISITDAGTTQTHDLASTVLTYSFNPAATDADWDVSVTAVSTDTANVIGSSNSNVVYKLSDIASVTIADGKLTWTDSGTGQDGFQGYEVHITGSYTTYNSQTITVDTTKTITSGSSYDFSDFWGTTGNSNDMYKGADLAVTVRALGLDTGKGAVSGNLTASKTVHVLASIAIDSNGGTFSGNGTARIKYSDTKVTSFTVTFWDINAKKSLKTLEIPYVSGTTSYTFQIGYYEDADVDIFAIANGGTAAISNRTIPNTKYVTDRPQLTVSGTTLSWTQVPYKYNALVFVDGSLKVSLGVADSYDISDLTSGSHTFVVATGTAFSSGKAEFVFSKPFTFVKLGTVDVDSLSFKQVGVASNLSWTAVTDATGYEIDLVPAATGSATKVITLGAVTTVDLTKYDVSDYTTTYTIKIRALGTGTISSDFVDRGNTIPLRFTKPTAFAYANGVVTFTKDTNCIGSNIYINGASVSYQTSDTYTLPLTTAGAFNIIVNGQPLDDDETIGSWSSQSTLAALTANVVSLDGDQLTWTVQGTDYILIVDGTAHYQTTATFDLSAAAYASGSHTVQLIVIDAQTSYLRYYVNPSLSVSKLGSVAASSVAIADGKLTWGAVTNASSYKVTVTDKSDATNTQTVDVSETSLDATVLGYAFTGATCEFQIQALGKGGDYINSSLSTAVEHAFLSAPSIQMTSNTNHVVIGSVPVDNATDYFVVVTHGSDDPVNYTYKLTDTRTFDITAVGAYAIKARSLAAGSTAYLSSPYYKTSNLYVLAPVTGLSVDATGKLSWTNPNTVFHGTLEYVVSINGATGSVYKTTSTYLIGTSVTSLTSLTVKVSSDDSSYNVDSALTALANPTSYSILPAPAVSYDATNKKLTWTQGNSTQVTGYKVTVYENELVSSQSFKSGTAFHSYDITLGNVSSVSLTDAAYATLLAALVNGHTYYASLLTEARTALAFLLCAIRLLTPLKGS